jgi:KaiC/GvpD/RAD55 family RecA-like ATPase
MRDDIDRARAALQAIPASLPREDWVKAGMAAKAAGLTLDDFTAWSSNADNYGGERDCRDVWASFKGQGIGPASLFAIAFRHGWSDSSRRTRYANQRQHSTPRQQQKPTAPRVQAADLWAQCEPASPQHGYIIAKRGNAEGLRQVPADSRLRIAGQSVAGWLVLPAVTLAGDMATLQLIPPPGQGKKLNLPGASFRDGLHIVGNLEDAARCYVVEGIGQAWACWQATGQPAAVAFGAGRTAAVVEALRVKSTALVLVPDRGKESQAEAIAAKHGAAMVRLPQDKPNNYDANDYAAEFGTDALEVLLCDARQPERRYRLRTAAELAALPPVRWLVRGVLPAEGLAAMFGASGSGKTFLALDLAGAVAEGRPWFTYRVNAAQVVYLGLEGEAGLSQRVQAWERHNRRAPPEGLRFVVSQPFDMLQAEDVAELAEACRAAGAGGGLVVVDTLNRAALGVDENSSQDMGRIIEAAADMQRRIGGLVLLIHHAGKDQSKGMRGHSSLHAALDAAIEVRREGEAREWRVAKSKDGRDAESIAFRLEVVTLGVEPDGAVTTSCAVVEEAEARADDGAGKAFTENMNMRTLLRLTHESAQAGDYISPSRNSPSTNAWAMLRDVPGFPAGLERRETLALFHAMRERGYLKRESYTKPNRHPGERWAVTAAGFAFAGIAQPQKTDDCANCANCADLDVLEPDAPGAADPAGCASANVGVIGGVDAARAADAQPLEPSATGEESNADAAEVGAGSAAQ